MLNIYSKKNIHGYSLIKDARNVLINHSHVEKLAKDYDTIGYMSEEVGRELDSLYDNPDYIVGIHRTGYTRINDEILNDIFNRGLYSNGDLMSSGANNGNYNIEKTVSFFNDLLLMIPSLKTCEGYKTSDGCIIVKIPKSYIGMKDGEVQPIFYKENTYQVRLIPEFIYGYIPVKDQKVDKIIHNPNYKDKHMLINDNFYYDDSVKYKYKRENKELFELKSVNTSLKYNMLYKAYKDTLEKYGYNQAVTALLELVNKNNVSYFTGRDNKINLSRYVAYNDIKKILIFGQNTDTKDINDLINLFTMQFSTYIQNENTK